MSTQNIIVTSSKIAAALSAVGVPFVSPWIRKVKHKEGPGQPKIRVSFHFADTTKDGKHSTFELIKAWHEPHKYLNQDTPLRFMGEFRAALENKDKLVGAAHDFLRAQNRGALEEFEPELMKYVDMAPTFVSIPKGKVFILVNENASTEEIKDLFTLAEKVNKHLP